MSLTTLLLALLVLIFIGALPAWPHARGWGYGPSGIIGLVLLILVIMMVARQI